ncbi:MULTISPECIES: sulfite exporter TauE/SafE family protein [Sphingobacterium]|uniref:Probable membrane transporter protein n=1 Tax=Sphingobacterium populi TaxID=1812824 RepID=A0ABW5UE28_9SPHI|nr:sulfite exporter TauE/SafE family protein [Sphingobacterium sp. CFCC 11742]
MYIIFLIIGVIITFVLSVLSGGGASLLVMPIITAFIGVRGVAPIMTIGIACSSVSKTFFFWKDIDWHLFKWLFPSTVIGSVIGARLLAEVPTDLLQVIIGLFLVSTVVQFKAPQQVEVEQKTTIKAWHFAPMGLIVSFLSGLIGGVGPLMNSAYLKYGMSKEALLGTRSANAILLHITKIISYAALGLIDGEIVKYGLIVGAASMIGVYFGRKLLGRISEYMFRMIVVSSMVLSGIYMLIKNKEYILSYLAEVSL